MPISCRFRDCNKSFWSRTYARRAVTSTCLLPSTSLFHLYLITTFTCLVVVFSQRWLPFAIRCWLDWLIDWLIDWLMVLSGTEDLTINSSPMSSRSIGLLTSPAQRMSSMPRYRHTVLPQSSTVGLKNYIFLGFQKFCNLKNPNYRCLSFCLKNQPSIEHLSRH